MVTFVVVVLGLGGAVVWGLVTATKAGPDQFAEMQFGPLAKGTACPHCRSTGKVRLRSIAQKTAAGGGNAPAAMLAGGVSMLAAAPAREAKNTQAHCMGCNSTWYS